MIDSEDVFIIHYKHNSYPIPTRSQGNWLVELSL
jgi:hypothetical protein